MIARLLVQRYCNSSSGLLSSLRICIAQTGSIWYFLYLRCCYAILTANQNRSVISTAIFTIGDIWVFPRAIAIRDTIAKGFCPSQLYCDGDNSAAVYDKELLFHYCYERNF
jgi:hypothetical protein